MVPSDAQADARALIAYYEGADVTCEMQGSKLICTSAGHRWIVNWYGDRISRDGVWIGDCGDLENRAVLRNRPIEPPPDLLPEVHDAPVTDLDADRCEELRAERRDYEADPYHRLESA